jgi:anti-anti-sigma factor
MDTDRAPESFSSRSTLADEHFATEVQFRDDITVVVVTGEVDLATRGAFASALCGLLEPGECVTVDLGGVTLLDGGSVGVALQLQRHARARGCDLTFAHPRGLVARVLEILDPDATLARTEST